MTKTGTQAAEARASVQRVAPATPHPLRALKADPRFSYGVYIPESVTTGRLAPRLLLTVHGSGRDADQLLHAFADTAEALGLVVLSPLFPVDVIGNGDGDGYKYLHEDGIDYIAVVDAMIAEVSARIGDDLGRPLLYGMSGGGQFVHRYAFIRPDRVLAVSAAAPGTVSLPGVDAPWWVGTADIAERFGQPLDIDALRRIRFHLTVGGLDLDTSQILPHRRSPYGMPGDDSSGETRVDRVCALAASLTALGVPCETEVVTGVAHHQEPLMHRSKRFFERVLAHTGRQGA